jgi:flagellar motor switch protein FliN/FliY
MTAETDATDSEEVETPADTAGAENETTTTEQNPESSEATGDAEGDVQVNDVDFQSLEDTTASGGKPQDLNRFQEIKVTVSADLGRANVPLQKLMSLGEGSVLELDREIGSPVELVAQGVTLALGEVVVVNGNFAIRVTKVYEGQAG